MLGQKSSSNTMKIAMESKHQLCPDCKAVWGKDSQGRLLSHCTTCRADRSLFLSEEMEAAKNTLGVFSFCESVFATAKSPWHIRLMTSAGKYLGGGIDTEGLCGLPRKRGGWDLSVGLTKHHLEHSACKKCLERYREETD